MDENEVTTTAAPSGGAFVQHHSDVVVDATWWWAVLICLCAIGFVANLIFVVTIVYNRRRHELQTFVTAIITTIAFLDILDVARTMPVLSKDLYDLEVFRHIYCSLGSFHELAVAVFIVSISIAVCVQAGKDGKLYSGNSAVASVAHKILIAAVLLLAAGAASPLFLLGYNRVAHTCTDPFQFMFLDVNAPAFKYDLYSTLVTVVTYAVPVLVIPLALPIATLRTCIAKKCCVTRYKQPIGELVMASVVCLVYFATIVGVVLPRIGQMMQLEGVQIGPVPLLWELGNSAIRPIVYFMTNPAVWDGLQAMCCRKKHQLVNNDEDMEEAEVPLAPVTTV